jgi:hypothetical protein
MANTAGLHEKRNNKLHSTNETTWEEGEVCLLGDYGALKGRPSWIRQGEVVSTFTDKLIIALERCPKLSLACSEADRQSITFHH